MLAGALLIIVLWPISGETKTYRYTDDSGAVHLTNDEKLIPQSARDSVQILSEDSPSDGFIPGRMPEKKDGSAEPAQERSNTWEMPEKSGASAAIDKLKGIDFNGLMARALRRADAASTTLMANTSPKILLAVTGILTLAVVLSCFIVIKRRTLRFLVLFAVLGCLYLVMFSMYYRSVQAKGGSFTKEVRKAKNLIRQHKDPMKEIQKILDE